MTYYCHKYTKTEFNVIRFGFVLFSKGATGLFFINQILNKSQVTISDSRVKKYMCSTKDAAKAVISICYFNSTGLVYSLDMGERYLLQDVVLKLMNYYGNEKEVKYIGLRIGNRLEEERYIQ